MCARELPWVRAFILSRNVKRYYADRQQASPKKAGTSHVPLYSVESTRTRSTHMLRHMPRKTCGPACARIKLII